MSSVDETKFKRELLGVFPCFTMRVCEALFHILKNTRFAMPASSVFRSCSYRELAAVLGKLQGVEYTVFYWSDYREDDVNNIKKILESTGWKIIPL